MKILKFSLYLLVLFFVLSIAFSKYIPGKQFLIDFILPSTMAILLFLRYVVGEKINKIKQSKTKQLQQANPIHNKKKQPI